MRRRLAVASIALFGLACVAGCGNERQPVPRVPRAEPPAGTRVERLNAVGVVFARPRNWSFARGRLPALALLGSGRATVGLWRYRRVETLPRTDEELTQARRALVNAARGRDRTLQVLSARVVRHGSVPAVQILATERIGSARRKVRSTHLYAHGAELVVDAYAPPDEFADVDRATFLPLLRSLRVTAPPRS